MVIENDPEEMSNREMGIAFVQVLCIVLIFLAISHFSKKEQEMHLNLKADEWSCEEYQNEECVMLRKLPPIN